MPERAVVRQIALWSLSFFMMFGLLAIIAFKLYKNMNAEIEIGGFLSFVGVMVTSWFKQLAPNTPASPQPRTRSTDSQPHQGVQNETTRPSSAGNVNS